jgi:putative ATP-binding cassette transporter
VKLHLLEFFRHESDQRLKPMLVAMLLSGIGNGALMAIANLGAASAEFTAARGLLLALYIAALTLYIAGLRRALASGFAASEQALERVRTRLTTRLLNADLAYVERHAESGRFTPLTQDTRLIANAMTQALYCLQMLGLFAVSGVYMAWKDPATFGMVALVFAGVLPLLIRNYRQATQNTLLSADSESAFITLFAELVSGFKEVKLNRARSEAIQKDLSAKARRAHAPRHKVNQSTIDGLQFSSGIFYLLIAVLVFVLPEIWSSYGDTVEQTLSTVLFLMGPLMGLASTLPMLARAEATVVGLYALEDEINAHSLIPTTLEPNVSTARATFEHLNLQAVSFQYTDPSGEVTFQCGPLDLQIDYGDLVFIIGGNGSGKSTLLKLLTGLYEPLEGELLLDGRKVDAALREQWRELFAIVFTDFHLFDRLYGMEHVDPAEVQRWLQVMGLEHKTRYQDGRFTQTSLSTGQRKRLAFIVAVLRNKPICVFDEVAADQDPEFRRRFYRELLPGLRARGTTVIVVSHDDAYFDCADRLIRLRDGRIAT